MTLAWWVYLVIIITAFICGVVLNYIVKKINDARLEERIIRLRNKASQSTQVQGPLIERETKTCKPLENIIANSNKGISLVFNKESNLDNDARKKEELLLNASTLSNAAVTKNISIRESTKCTTSSKTNIPTIPRRILNNNLMSGHDLCISLSKKETSHLSRPNIDKTESPTFLGYIYKNDLSKTMAKSQSGIIECEDSYKEVVEKILGNMNESKSTPSIHKLYDLQNDQDIRRWISDIVLKSKCAEENQGTSSNK